MQRPPSFWRCSGRLSFWCIFQGTELAASRPPNLVLVLDPNTGQQGGLPKTWVSGHRASTKQGAPATSSPEVKAVKRPQDGAVRRAGRQCVSVSSWGDFDRDGPRAHSQDGLRCGQSLLNHQGQRQAGCPSTLAGAREDGARSAPLEPGPVPTALRVVLSVCPGADGVQGQSQLPPVGVL